MATLHILFWGLMKGTVLTLGTRHRKEGKANIHNDDDDNDNINNGNLFTCWLNSLMINNKDSTSTVQGGEYKK